MHQIHPKETLIPIIERCLATDLHYHLFGNDVTPDADTVLGDLTELVGTGYAPIAVAGADFISLGVADGRATVVAPTITFTPGWSSDQDAYGYYVTDVANAVLLAVARFDSAPVIVKDTAPLTVLPIWGEQSRFSS